MTTGLPLASLLPAESSREHIVTECIRHTVIYNQCAPPKHIDTALAHPINVSAATV